MHGCTEKDARRFKVTDKHVIFHGSVFSNWYMPATFWYDGLKFPSSEHFMMWKKAIHFGDLETAYKILTCKGPDEAKDLGRTVKNFVLDEWDKVCYSVVKQAIRLKFTQNPDLAAIMLEVGKGKTFVEGSPVDKRWGVGIDWKDPNADDESQWKGTNWLGKCLTEIYKELAQ